MTEQEIAKMRAWLLVKLQSLTQGMSSQLQELSGGGGGHLADLEEMSADVSADGAVFESFRSKSETIASIEDALHRIEQGTYGKCEACTEAINIERLDALPFAALCISCQRKSEEDPNFGMEP